MSPEETRQEVELTYAKLLRGARYGQLARSVLYLASWAGAGVAFFNGQILGGFGLLILTAALVFGQALGASAWDSLMDEDSREKIIRKEIDRRRRTDPAPAREVEPSDPELALQAQMVGLDPRVNLRDMGEENLDAFAQDCDDLIRYAAEVKRERRDA